MYDERLEFPCGMGSFQRVKESGGDRSGRQAGRERVGNVRRLGSGRVFEKERREVEEWF